MYNSIHIPHDVDKIIVNMILKRYVNDTVSHTDNVDTCSADTDQRHVRTKWYSDSV